MKKWTTQEINDLRSEYPINYNKVLCKKYGVSEHVLAQKASQLKIKKAKSLKSPCYKLPLEKDEIINLYLDGYTYKEIGKFCNTSPATIFWHVKNSSIFNTKNLPQKRIYNFDIHFFDSIDTEEKAYFLGLIYADGYNYQKSGIITLRLVESDIAIVKKLQSAVKSNQPIKSIKYPKFKDQCSFSMCSIYMSKVLASYGCTQAKSLTLQFPTCVPDSLLHHFCRGYFDGDGCISFKGIKPNISLIGTLQCMESFQNLFIANTGIKKTKMHFNGFNSYYFGYNGRLNCLKIRNWLYKDATIYLQRKYDRFFSFSSNPKKIIPPSAYGSRKLLRQEVTLDK